MLVGWDTLEVPTYRHEAFAGVPVGTRVRRVAARAARAAAAAVHGARASPRRRRPATRRTTSSPRPSRTRRRAAAPCSSRAATATRSSSSSDRTTILQPDARRQRDRADRPGRGARALRRRAARRCPTSSRFAAIRRTSCRARRASARRPPRPACSSTSSLEAMLAEGRFSAQADELRLYRRIAAMDADGAAAGGSRRGARLGRRRRARAARGA